MNFSVIVPFFGRKTFLNLVSHFLKRKLTFARSLNILEEMTITSKSEDIAKDGLYIAKVIGQR